MTRRLVYPAICLLALSIVSHAEEAATTTAPSGSAAPVGAVVLFDGTNTDAWTTKDGKPCPWKILDAADAIEVGGGDIVSKETFEDYTLHVEFWLPKNPPEVTGQARSNSGVFLQRQYEIQILDSYGEEPKKNGCGAIYGRKKPKENACTPPETWQTYDIKFTAAKFDESGKKLGNARVTVIHNGVTIHQDVEIEGSTGTGRPEASPGAAPIVLQDHSNPVRYRNIWVKPTKTSATRGASTRLAPAKPPQ